MQDEYEMYKIVVIGSSGTGKTNISTRFIRDYFQQSCQTTLGVEFLTKVVQVNNKSIKISLWDTAGQERYKALSKVYYKGASGVIIVYDITDAKSYLDLESWMRLDQNLSVQDIVMMVVGNKVDRQDQREVPAQRPLQQFKEAFDIDCYEVSAKTGQNINKMFNDMIAKIIEKTNDNIKGTLYRGTAEYESQRGTYIRSQIKAENPQSNHIKHNSSIILEQQEDLKSVGFESQQQKKGVPGNRISLNVNDHKQNLKQNKQKKKKKCC